MEDPAFRRAARDISDSAFARFEIAGWEDRADAYDDFFAPITSSVIDDLITTADIGPGSHVLDVGTGPGYVAAACATRGADAIGVDVAQQMVDLARTRYPTVEFRQADAHELPFANDTFDAVVANFTIPHLPAPRDATTELARTLRPGGALALSTWDRPESCRVIGLLVDAIADVGAPPPTHIPDGPNFFGFADDSKFGALMTAAGLVNATINTVEFLHRFASAEELWNGLINSTVRTRETVLGQPPDIQARIRDRFDTLAEAHRQNDHLLVPISVKIASAIKPQMK